MSDSERQAPNRTSNGEYSNNSNFRILKSYDEIVRTVVDLVQLAREEIYLASRYYEPVVGNNLVQKFAEGISLNILDGNPSGTTFVDRIREAARFPTRERDLLKTLLDSPKVRIERAKIEYSFIVVDRFHCAFELHNPLNPTQFYKAIRIDESELADTLIELFNESLQLQQIT